nr:RNA-directed DNA polymerase, eukaryota, reverse transcriptase zinc-binding domain protein [Tanacetum cinerariifolium]
MNKSNLMGISVDSNNVKHAAAKIGCLVLKTPFNYLGSRVGDLMSRIQSWHDVTEGMHTWLSKWKLKILSIGGRLTLLKSVLGAISIYHMSIFKVPMKVLQNIESIRACFFNGADVNSKKLSWVRWKNVLAAKDVGGHGVSSLFALNQALMFKWVWRFFSQKNSLWVRVVKALHGEDEKIGEKVQPSYPSTWLNIINEIESLKSHGIDLVSFITPKLGNEANTSFWDVAWCGDIAFKNLVPILYALESMKNIEAASKLSHGGLEFSFRRNSRGGVEQAQFKRKLIDNAILLKGISKTRWIKVVSIKINVHAWKRDVVDKKGPIFRAVPNNVPQYYKRIGGNKISLTKAGNPIKKILLKLNLSDHRKLKDGGEECSSCGALYTTDYCCSNGSPRDKIICDLDKTPDLSQKPPQKYPKYGNPVDDYYCQGCALLRKKFMENLFTYCIKNGILQDSFEPSNDNTNVVNALQEPFVVEQDPGAHYGYNCPLKISIFSDPEPFNNQTIDELPQTLPSFDPTCYSEDGNSFTYDSISNLVHDSPNYFVVPQPPQEEMSVEFMQEKRNQMDYVKTFLRKFNRIFYEMLKFLSLAWETILEIELAFEDKHCQPEDILELFRRLHNEEQNIQEELAVYINTPNWDRPTVYYDDDDEDYAIAVTPSLSIEEPDNSLSMGDEHLDTISVTESDEFIKSSVESLVPIPSESEGILDNMCDVPFHENSPPLDVLKDQFEDFYDSNDESTSIDDYSFSIDNIEYVEASPPNSELVSLEISSDNFTTHSNIYLPEYEAFYDDHVKEISSGSTTTHSDSSLYDSFIFDLLINPFPPVDRSDFYEFADELAHIISPPEYDCFCFKNEPNSGDFTMDVVDDIFLTREPKVHNALPTHPTRMKIPFLILASVVIISILSCRIIPGNLKTHVEGFCPPVFISSASLGNHTEHSRILAKTKNDSVKLEVKAKQGLFRNPKSSYVQSVSFSLVKS